MTVEVPPTFHIYYATGWEEPVLRVRELSPDGMPINEVPCYLLSEVRIAKILRRTSGICLCLLLRLHMSRTRHQHHTALV